MAIKYTKITTTLPNGHKTYQMGVKYTKRRWNIPTFSILRPSKIYPNWDFWFENVPSCNPTAQVPSSAAQLYVVCTVNRSEQLKRFPNRAMVILFH
jgi:hypothetical protein